MRTLAAVLVGLMLGLLVVPKLSASHNQPGLHNRVHAVHWAFCGKQTRRPCALGYQAVRVVKCESGWSMTPRAHNGQYLGAFQMGGYARGRYGHSWNIWGQAAAAFRYFRDAGWSPWSCARIVGVR